MVFVMVKAVQGPTLAISIPGSADQVNARSVLLLAAEKMGLATSNADLLGLEFSGRQLDLDASLGGYGVVSGSTVRMTCRVQGGKPAQVRLLNPLACGSNVTVDIEDDTPMYEVKLQLQELTGVPVSAQKVMLQGVGQIVMGDKRTNIGFTHSGSTGSFYLGLLGGK